MEQPLAFTPVTVYTPAVIPPPTANSVKEVLTSSSEEFFHESEVQLVLSTSTLPMLGSSQSFNVAAVPLLAMVTEAVPVSV